MIVLPKADNTFVYTPTNSERNAIKKNGLVVQGYGMSVTEVNSVTVAELHSKPESKKAIAACASAVSSIKAVLDTPLLTEEGDLTEESETVALQIDGEFQSDRQLEDK